MTGPTYTPDWDKHKDNPDFEHAVYSDRLHLDDLFRTDLVTRSGKPVIVKEVSEHYASGLVDGEPEQWYVGGRKSMLTGEDLGSITLVREADSPHEHDVMLPLNNDSSD